MLQRLREANCVLSLASHTDGPRDWASPLREITGSDAEPTEGMIEDALELMRRVETIVDQRVRAVLLSAANTCGCRKIWTVREVAKITGLSGTTVHRLLQKGCAMLRESENVRMAA